MAEDPVYEAFVLPFYREALKTASAEQTRADRMAARAAAEKSRADEEAAKAAAEKIRADKEAAKAARLAEQLRRLGLPEE
jgi:hypothetical protein